MKTGNLLIALVIGGVIGFVIGKATTSSTPAAPTPGLVQNGPEGSGGKGDLADTVYRIPLGDSPVEGPADAKVTIVEFSDFECPFCARAYKTVKQLMEAYPKDVRLIYKQNPLPFHAHSHIAAEASLAAKEQGKFWEMYSKLFENRDHLERADLDKYAQDIGLDMSKFKADMDSHKFNQVISADQALATRFNAAGTPHFFINGIRLVGAQPYEQFKQRVDEEIRKANQLIAAGTPAAQVYDAITRNGKDHATAAQNRQNAPQRQQVVDVKTGDGPSKGPKDAKVTIVEFSDFQCPYCGRAWPVVDKILKEYPKDVRFFFRNEPLPFHPNAMPAAIAAAAAGRQGKFWEFYDLAFQNQREESPAKYDEWAKQIHLNMEKFHRDIADPKTKESITADSDYARTVGANGTPTFFVNGRLISGALPFESFKGMIDDEIKTADNLLNKGVPRSDIYAEMVKYNIANAPKQAAAPGDDGKPVQIAIGNSPVRGPSHAPVTIIEFSDFQCPFCGRVEPTIAQLMNKYEGKIRFVWKNEPLPFHPNARPAAKAALAAEEQGKFWQMHDKLFANQTQLNPDNYIAWAKDLNLNVDKFKSDMDSPRYDAILDADAKLGQSVGANGTPTFFINGHKIVGAQPIENFSRMIDEQLKLAQK